MASVPGGKERSRQLFQLVKEFAEVFQSHQFQQIHLRWLTQAYQFRHKKNFSLKKIGFSSLEKFVDEVPVFSRNGTAVTLNRSALLTFFFRPVLEECGGSATLQQLARVFKQCTGLDINSVGMALELSSVEALVTELVSGNDDFFELTKVDPNSPEESIVRIHHPSCKPKAYDSNQIQNVQQLPERLRDGNEKMETHDEYPPVSAVGKKTLLPNPMSPMINNPPMYMGQLSQHPNLGLQSHFDPRGVPISPQQTIHPPLSPQRIESCIPVHHSPVLDMGVPTSIHGNKPPPILFSQNPVVPQVITTGQPRVARQPVQFAQHPHAPSIDPEQQLLQFPYPNLELGHETILPSHSAFRQDLPVPSIRPGATELPVSKKKRATLDTKQKIVEKINAKLEEVISDLSSQGKFLQPDTIRKLLLEMLNKANQGRSYNERVNQRDITVMGNYSKVHGRIDELIKVFCWFCPVTSLHELEQALIESEKVDSYEALQLGPITKHPRVIDLFKLQEAPTLDTVPDMSAYKIHNYLMKFISKSRNRASKFSVEDFLEYIREKEFAESVYHLCIRITSFPLAIQTNFRFRTSQSQARRRMETAIEDEMKVLLQHETDKLRKKLSGAHADDPLSIRRDLAGKDPIQILLSIFDACNKYFKGPQQAKAGAFMQMVTEKPALRHLFLLAIYEGAYGAERLIPKFMDDHYPSHSTGVTAIQQDVFLQPKGEVLRELLAHLRRTRFPVDIGSLARIEEMIADDKFGAPNFDSLGNGSFLAFLASHDEACEALGGKFIGTNLSPSHISSVKQKVLSIVHQLKFDKRDDQEAVSACVTAQFGVDSFESLGCGSVHKLVLETQYSQNLAQTSAVAYLSPLLLNGDVSLQESKQGVGILGHQSPEDALSCLQSAPLLEDLKQWSHWELVFQPQHGALEEFLQRQPDHRLASAVHALEIAPGQLLRIDPSTSVTDFVASLSSDCPDPVDTAGYLVSLIVKRRSTRDISLQLLASHVTTCLEKMVASDSSGTDPSEVAAQFTFSTLIRIPFKLCRILAVELFIDPLRKVTSATTVNGLMRCCTTSEQRRFLQALGMAIGIKSWTDDFKLMLSEANHRKDDTFNLNNPTEKYPTQNISLDENDSSSGLHEATQSALSMSNLDDNDKDVETSTVEEFNTDDNTTADTEVNVQTDEQFEEKESRCKEIVQSIRHDEFGIGIDLDPQQQLVAEKQREREGRGIKRLSLELYSKETHFVLELIQNADDNDYHPHILSGKGSNGEVPSLKFVVSTHTITVLNNEMGFSEKNIRAICDVGKSTKGAHRSGYIGQKGIGFKSVFRVTDAPEIHSNGFHIGFDASADPIGFILPHWIDGSHVEQQTMWRTKIILTLKESHLSSNMTKKFNDIQPSLLLFLYRLKSITVQDEVSGQERQMLRRDMQRGIIDIQHTNGDDSTTDRWLVVKKVLDKASEFKPDVEMTELALAFPITPDLSTITLAKDLQQQQVFAFLPLRSYGFRFILQGDFDLPSSREDVNSDSPWNQWLREEIPMLFVKALEKMKELPNVSVMQAVAQFLQFVPLEGELHDFFQPVTSQILNLIKGTSCLPSDPWPLAQSTNLPLKLSLAELITPTSEQGFSCEEVHWKQPSQLLFVKEKFRFIREHIPQALLMNSLKLSYLNSSLLPFINPALQYQLGMGSITIDHLVEVAQVVTKLYIESPRDLVVSDLSDSEESDIFDDSEEVVGQVMNVPKESRKLIVRWMANWLACVHMVMDDSNDMGAETIEKLKKFAVLPLEGGMMATTSETSLFFPPDDTTGEHEVKSGSREFKAIFKEMSVIETSLFEEGDSLVQSRVRKVLELIGVRNLYPADIIKHHILPQFTKGSWKNKNKDLLRNFLVYIKECTEQPGSGVKEREIIHLLKDSVVLVTNKGPKLPSKEIIHFSSSYLPDPDLEKLFPDVNWTVVKADYLKKSKTREAILSWVHFLRKLGVKIGIAVQQVNVNIPEDSPESNKLRESQWRRLPAGGLTLRDWQSDEFERIVKSVASKSNVYQQQQMKKLAELLDKNWDIEYKRYLNAEICDERNENYLDTTTSSFHQFIVQHAWLPSNSDFTNTSKSLYCGRELFDTSRQVRCLLHTHVPYIGAQLKNEEFVNLLCIKRSVSIDDLISYLLKWMQCSIEDDVPFYTSIDHMSNVYRYLKQESEDQKCSTDHLSGRNDVQNIAEKFQEEKLIFVPDRYQENTSKEDVAGHFHTVHSVCLNDPSTVLYTRQKLSLPLATTLPKVLSLYYFIREDQTMNSQLQQAFVYFGVPEVPRVASFITLMNYISTISHHPEPEHVRDFTSIAFELVRRCNEEASISPEFIYNNLKNAKVFPTTSRVWVSLQDCLLEDDDKNIAKCFQKSDNVFFILWPDIISSKKKPRNVNKQQSFANLEAKEEFIQICKISKLSKKVSPRVDFGGEARPVDRVKSHLNIWVPLIQRFIAANCQDLNMRLKDGGIQDKLHRLQVLSVMSLSCRYFIDHSGSQIASPGSIKKDCEYCFDDDTSTIYIAADKVEKPGALLPALRKLFAVANSEEENDTIESFLEKLLLACPTKRDEVEDLEYECDLPSLPDSETAWEVPIPKHQQFNKEESTTTDEETDSQSSEDDNVEMKDSAESRDLEAAEGAKGLTSWPPNAAVDPSAIGPRHMKRLPDTVRAINPINKDFSASIIGEEEVKEARKKHLQEYGDASRLPTQRDDLQSVSDQSQGKIAHPFPPSAHSQKSPDSSNYTKESLESSNERKLSSDNRPPTCSQPNVSNSNLPEKSSEPVHEQQTTVSFKSVQSKPSNRSHQRYSEDSKWKAVKKAGVDPEIDLIDIQGIVQNIEVGNDTPLVELLEDITSDDESRQMVGRWGEQYVYIALKKMGQLPDGTLIKSIMWINEDQETDKPYDIIVEIQSESESDPVIKSVYIEVKSTAASKKELVSISLNQIKFAEEYGGDFHLYRVYSAGQRHSRLCYLENLYSYIKGHHIRFFFEL